MREKRRKAERLRAVILGVVGLLLVGAAYFFQIYQPIELQIRDIQRQRQETEDAILTLQAKVSQMKRMQDEIHTLNLQQVSRMESYNNSKAELALLNSILAETEDYTVTFQRVTQEGNQVRRSFALTFSADSFPGAMNIIQRLQESRLRCLIGNVAYSAGEDGVRMSVDATFYETMAGGVPDAGLPADTSAQE